jgi:hypothetical protein
VRLEAKVLGQTLQIAFGEVGGESKRDLESTELVGADFGQNDIV